MTERDRSQLQPPAGWSGDSLPIGTRLGEFEITALVGEGGFGLVYVAEDHTLQRRVAIKEYMPVALSGRGPRGEVVVKDERHRDTFAAGLKSFINEARLLASFDHPSLVKVYRFWEANGTAYMVMPFLEGTTLKDVLRGLPQPPDEAWLRGVLGPLTEALGVIHAEQCYHRDIAPDNVMLLSSTNRWLLLDFGAARRVIGDLTQAITVILKPGYAPIEQYAEIPGMKQGPWTDVYALAAVVYYAIMGKTPPSSVGRLLNDTYMPLQEAAAGRYSPQFLAAIDRALAVRPEQRTPSIEQFRAELGLAGIDTPAPLGAPAQAVPRPVSLRPPGDAVTGPGAVTRIVSPPVPAALALPHDVASPLERTQLIGHAAGGPGSPAVTARVVVTASPDPKQIMRYAVHDGQRLEIGRECEGLRIDDPECSRRHVAIELTADGYRIVDLGSANATWVNGQRLTAGQATPLLFGSSIRIGATILRFTPDSPSQDDFSGNELAGRYVLRELLKSTAKGALYRATSKDSNFPVAIKVLGPHVAAMRDYRLQFENEAAIAVQLRHPHICELRDFGYGAVVRPGGELLASQVPFLCYSLLAGGSLEDRMRRAPVPGHEQVLRWIAHLSEALQHAHERKVVHGNLKPSAVCFDPGGEVYLADFAIAERTGGLQLGTPAYMAPEQWTGGPTTPRSDQFSLAVMAYELIGGARPFEGQDDPTIRGRNFRRGPDPVHAEAEQRGRPAVAAAVSQVLARALKADPAQRFESMQDFAAALGKAFRPGSAATGEPEVFISYQRDKSAGWAVLIQSELRDKHGIKSFVDSQRFDGALRFPDKIARAVEGCEVFVCLLAATTLRSRWVREEIRIAHRAARPMIPVFQESFKRHAPVPDDPAVHALLQYDGLDLLDRRNIHVHHTIADLVHQIRLTLSRKAD